METLRTLAANQVLLFTVNDEDDNDRIRRRLSGGSVGARVVAPGAAAMSGVSSSPDGAKSTGLPNIASEAYPGYLKDSQLVSPSRKPALDS